MTCRVRAGFRLAFPQPSLSRRGSAGLECSRSAPAPALPEQNQLLFPAVPTDSFNVSSALMPSLPTLRTQFFVSLYLPGCTQAAFFIQEPQTRAASRSGQGQL